MKLLRVHQWRSAKPVELAYDNSKPAYEQLTANGWHVLNVRHQAGVTTLSATSAPESHHDRPLVPGRWITGVWFIQLATADFYRLFQMEDL